MKIHLKYSALGILSLGLVGATMTTATAMEHGKRQKGERPSFEMLDTNSDGFITAEDAEAKRQEGFASIDTNGDGFLTLEELQAAPKGAGGKFGRGGKGGKGKHAGVQEPTAEQIVDRSQRILRYLDQNGDGKVAFDEMPNRGEGRMIARLDTDEDGKISPAEFEEAKAKFGKRKKNRDGAQGDVDAQ